MKLYGAIDLHSTNNVMVLIDEEDQIVYEKRLPNDLTWILTELSVYQERVEGIVVESTYNWYWLVDGLMAAGYKVHLANTAAIQQYEGLKYTDDHSDTRWLAHLLRLGVLPEGYIYPRAERPVRDLLRKRSQLVRHRTTNLLSIENLYTRNTGQSLSAKRIKGLEVEEIDALFPVSDLALAIKANFSVLRSADQQVQILEQTVIERGGLGHPLAGRSSRHRRSREINFFISFSSTRWLRDLSVTRPCFLFIRCRIAGPHQSPPEADQPMAEPSSGSRPWSDPYAGILSRPWQVHLPPEICRYHAASNGSGFTDPMALSACKESNPLMAHGVGVPADHNPGELYLRDGTAANQTLWL